MRPTKHYNRQSQAINVADENAPPETREDRRHQWEPRAILALALVSFIGIKFLLTSGVDARELLSILVL